MIRENPEMSINLMYKCVEIFASFEPIALNLVHTLNNK